MDDILGKSVSELPEFEFDCSCGRKHRIRIKNIYIGQNNIDIVSRLAAYYGNQKIFFIADANTYAVYGNKVEKSLKREGFNLKTFIFKTDGTLIPDENALSRLLIEIETDTRLIISVGSGTLNDLAKILSFKLHIPYYIVCTAPSTDGYASTVSQLITDGFKKTFEAVYADSIIANTTVLKDTPPPMIQAGFGEIIGKLNCLTDWILARELNGEYYCETTAKFMLQAVEQCINNVDLIYKRKEAAIHILTEALIISGIATSLVGNLRPVSGAEHHLAHYWEMDAIANGHERPLYGNAVGVGTVVISSIYEMMAGRIPSACEPAKSAEIAAILKRVGACYSPKSLGISRELFHESVIHAKEVCPHYTVLHLASSYGLLGKFADELTQKFYD